jgi:signal transduction histidine kinase/CheY-like chemotaxis protein
MKRLLLLLICFSHYSLAYSVVEIQPAAQPALLLWGWIVLSLFLVLVIGGLGYKYRQLKQSHHRLKLLWQHAPDTFTEVDAQGKICAVNKASSDETPIEGMVGTSRFDYLNEADSAVFREQLKSTLNSGCDSEYSQILVEVGGSRYLSNRIIALPSVFGDSPRALLMTTDISHYQEEQGVLHEAKKLAEDNAEAQSLFLANMTHEIRTPLNGIQGIINLISESNNLEEINQYTVPLLSSADHLRQIVDDVLDLSKSDAGQIELDESNVSLWHILDDLEALYLPQTTQKQIMLQIKLASNVPRMIHVDAFRLRQVLYNLMSNAVKFTEQGSVCLSISAQQVSQKSILKIAVLDTGIGINTQQQTHIFDVFRQASAGTTRSHGGTGLGLSICRNLVEAMDGVISVQSEPGKGSEFWFTLPLKVTEAVADLSLWQEKGVFLAIQDKEVNTWFSEFFQTLKIEVHRLKLNAPLPADSLLVSDHVNNVDEKWLWWLGDDYQMNQTVGVCLVRPFRREGLCKRLNEYEQMAYGQANDGEQQSTQAHLLLVEDNLTNQLVVRKTLEKMNYQVSIANNGIEGVEAFKRGAFDGIIMDVQMPVMDGIEATRTIRHLPGRYVPIIALTANAQTEIEEACFAAGMDAFLTKPVNRLELQNMLESILGSDQHQHQSSA